MNDSRTGDGMRIDVNNFEPEEAMARLLEQAAELAVSDLFLTSNETHVAVLARHFGILRQLMCSPSTWGGLLGRCQGPGRHGCG